MKRIGFLAYPGVEELDLVGPWEMATMWRDYADGPETLVVAETVESLRCAKGLGMVPDHSFANCPPLDALLVPGGVAAFDQMDNPALVGFVRTCGQTCQHMLSVCSGSFILLKAGVLAGKKATTHWKAIPPLREAGIDVVEQRYVRDGTVWTSGGVSAGIDLMLHFIAQQAGEEVAGIVQHNAEYYPENRLFGALHRDPAMPAYMKNLG